MVVSLEERLTQYQDDEKERDLELQELRAENKRLRLQNLNTAKFEEWGHEQICEWILSLGDGRMRKYEEALRQSLEEEEVDGSMLGEVDGGDLKGWGITKFADKKFLQQQIAVLVGKQQPAPLAQSAAPLAKEGAQGGTLYH